MFVLTSGWHLPNGKKQRVFDILLIACKGHLFTHSKGYAIAFLSSLANAKLDVEMSHWVATDPNWETSMGVQLEVKIWRVFNVLRTISSVAGWMCVTLDKQTNIQLPDFPQGDSRLSSSSPQPSLSQLPMKKRKLQNDQQLQLCHFEQLKTLSRTIDLIYQSLVVKMTTTLLFQESLEFSFAFFVLTITFGITILFPSNYSNPKEISCSNDIHSHGD